MRKLLTMSALALAVVAATPAHAGAGRWGTDLKFVADTTIPSNGTQTIAVCHVVDFMQVLFVPVYTIVDGYALSNDGCTGDMYRELSNEHLADLKAAGMVPNDVPETPQVSLAQLAWGHAWLIAGALGVMLRALGFLMQGGRRHSKNSAPDTLAIHSLVAMSQVAIADGTIDEREIKQISSILTRLTGRGYSMEQVSDLLTHLNPSPNDLDQVGQDLSEADRQIVLEAALNIAVADGEIHPNEYAVVSDLAQRMRVGADQFRSALNRISAHMNATQPA